MGMEQNIQRFICKSKNNSQKRQMLKFYDVASPLYLETDTSGIGLGATLLHTRE